MENVENICQKQMKKKQIILRLLLNLNAFLPFQMLLIVEGPETTPSPAETTPAPAETTAAPAETTAIPAETIAAKGNFQYKI